MSFRNEIETLREELIRISGDWNGKDAHFTSGGIGYSEEQAGSASDAVGLLDELVPILESLNLIEPNDSLPASPEA